MTHPATHGVLFDLDGTLLDTAPDMAAALNRLLIEEGRSPLPFEAIRPYVSHGAIALVKLGFGLAPDAPGFAALRQRFLDHYAQAVAVDTALFPGMAELLLAIEQADRPWGIVTNKPTSLTLPLLEAMGLTARCGVLVCGDTLPQRKPDPAPLLHAARRLGRTPDSCWYVGDAIGDVQAALAAGMPVLIAAYGYLATDDRPGDWGAHGIALQAADLTRWLMDTATP